MRLESFRPPYQLDIAATVGDVELRLQTFLNGSRSDGARLSEVLSIFMRRFEDVAILGGMVRDFARVGAPGFHSDVDLVIDAPADVVSDFSRQIGARTNAFGGNSVILDGWEVDFWAMETTWAAREGHVVLSRLEDVPRSTFFDHDAILYHLGRRQVICDEGYVSRQHLNSIEINLEPNASINGCLYRATRRMLGWEMKAGPRLESFIDRNLNPEAFAAMAETERRKNATPIVQSFLHVSGLREVLLKTPANERK